MDRYWIVVVWAMSCYLVALSGIMLSVERSMVGDRPEKKYGTVAQNTPPALRGGIEWEF